MSFTSDFDHFAPVSTLQAAGRFDAYFDVYGLSLKQPDGPLQRAITLIARSPASPAAQALAINLGRFEPGTVDVGIIFSEIAPAASLDFILQALAAAQCQAPEDIIRWAKNRALLDAHERLTLGRCLSWTGDTMRRADHARSPFERVDDVNPVMLAEAHASFAAIWKASKSLPKALLTRPAPSLFERPDQQSRANYSPEMQGDFTAARLTDYLRIRRH